MITRRRGRTMNKTEALCLEVEMDPEDIEEVLSSPSEGSPAEDIDSAGIDLDDLFTIDDFNWTLERDLSSPLLDVELSEMGMYGARGRDSGIEVSTASSPERISTGLKIKKSQNLSSHVINKNAIAARLNRLKKKEYVESLEGKVGILATENDALKQENCQLTKRVEELEDETRGPTQTTTTMPYRGNA
ncbi:uncharacterized protein crebzf [Genypterus blacodes]|uniref:uncharacterized protein crebzf n=1 Tax=Genypterus blacodes TaxID=154954 RepID=UPI003F768FFA